MLSYIEEIVKKLNTKNKAKSTLQVRTKDTALYKRAYGITSSITVEAALALPLILFAIVLLMMPFRMMEVSRKMQAVAESVCKDACKYAYTYKRVMAGLDDTDESTKEEDKDAHYIESLIASGALGAYAADRASELAADEYVGWISFLRTECMSEDDMITIVLDYKYALPFSVYSLGGVDQSVTASRRAWVGSDGMEVEAAGEDEDEEDDTYVYVGKNSTRYHLSATCHYLYNDLHAVNVADIASQRNEYGGKYYPCARCAKAGLTSGSVYIMPSGTSYHTSADCTAIIAYVKKVKLSEVEHLGACSYCGGS